MVTQSVRRPDGVELAAQPPTEMIACAAWIEGKTAARLPRRAVP
jgi:hypothetical protein